jgi:hypothetical protein
MGGRDKSPGAVLSAQFLWYATIPRPYAQRQLAAFLMRIRGSWLKEK